MKTKTMQFRNPLLLCAGLLALALTPDARAVSVVSNLGEAAGGVFSVDSAGTAAPFTVGSQDWVMNFATARLTGASTAGSATYHAYIYGDSGGVPGSSLYDLGTWERTDAGGPPMDHDFIAPANSTLMAATTYWMVMFAVTDSGHYGHWLSTISDNETGAAGWTIGNGGIYLANPSSPEKFVQQFAIDASLPVTGVPDAGSTLPLLGAGLAGLVAFHRRRTRINGESIAG